MLRDQERQVVNRIAGDDPRDRLRKGSPADLGVDAAFYDMRIRDELPKLPTKKPVPDEVRATGGG